MRITSRVYGALLLTVLFWGMSFIGTKAALTSFHPFALMFLRFASAAIFFSFLLNRKSRPKITRRDHLKLMLLTLFQPGLYFMFETFGLRFTSASKASLIIAAVPVFVTIFAFIFIKEKIGVRQVLGILLSVTGTGVLVAGTPGFRFELGGSLLGDLLILGAVVAAALYTILARKVGEKLPAIDITGYQFLYGSIFFFPFFLATFSETTWNVVPAVAWGALAFLIVFATIGAFLTYNYSLTKISASRASVFINGIPVVTTLASWFLLGERLTGIQIAGGFTVVLAVYIASSGKNRETSAPVPTSGA